VTGLRNAGVASSRLFGAASGAFVDSNGGIGRTIQTVHGGFNGKGTGELAAPPGHN
jgi:hypothetical protein